MGHTTLPPDNRAANDGLNVSSLDEIKHDQQLFLRNQICLKIVKRAALQG